MKGNRMPAFYANWSRVIFKRNVTRWVFLGILIGVVSGIGAAGFFYALQLVKHFTFHELAGYSSPAPQGELLFEAGSGLQSRPWVFFLLPLVGGLLSGLIVYRFAPEAEGHGTDAMIDAFHNKGGRIRPRVPFIKSIATICTLACGGSAGREGPIAQIGAGFGSMVAGFFKLSDRERRILLVAGCGAGLSAIFRAPLGGALPLLRFYTRKTLRQKH